MATETKRLVVLGAGESGVGAALLAQKNGCDVFVSDSGKVKEKYSKFLNKEKISWEEGMHTTENILNASEIVKSPGIPESAAIIKQAKEKGIPVISEIEFAGRYTNAKMICVTGSNGKTTTTMLTYHILKKAGYKVGLGGNVGTSLAMQVANTSQDYYVVELSSFQLDNMYKFKADVAVLLNITPDHLDRYNYSFKNYIASKFRITQNQTEQDAFIYCIDDENITNTINNMNISANRYPFSIKQDVDQGAQLNKEKQIIININPNPLTMSIQELALQGKHNIYNSMAAAIAAKIVDVRKDVIRESLADFQNVEHRLEFVAKVHGIEFINDSKATNVNSTWYALESMNNQVVWIVGGVDKGNDYSSLKQLVKEKVKAIVCLGVDNKKIIKTFSKIVPTIIETVNAQEAVKQSFKLGSKGDTVLLSPACASFDLFENYEDRGQQFKKAVRAL